MFQNVQIYGSQSFLKYEATKIAVLIYNTIAIDNYCHHHAEDQAYS